MIQARNRFSEIQHVASVAHRAVESLVISGATPVSPVKEVESTLEKEILKLKSKVQEKDTLHKKLQETIQRLESEVENMKELTTRPPEKEEDDSKKKPNTNANANIKKKKEEEDGKGFDSKEVDEMKKTKGKSGQGPSNSCTRNKEN